MCILREEKQKAGEHGWIAGSDANPRVSRSPLLVFSVHLTTMRGVRLKDKVRLKTLAEQHNM